MRSAATRAQLIVLIFPMVLLVLALFGGNVLVWRLFFLSVLLLLLAYLWAQIGLRGIYGKVEYTSRYYQVGDFLRGEAQIRSTSAWPKLMLRLWQSTNLPGYTNRQAINLPPRGSHHWQTEVRCSLRGRYQLGPLTIEATDPFGLIKLRRDLGDGQDLLVYPRTVEVSFSPAMPTGESGLAQNSWLRSAPSGIVSWVREYSPGESLNHIHWRATAHAGRMMVKEFSLDAAKNTWIVVDLAKASLPSGNTASVVEESITMAASLAKKYLVSGRSLGLMTEGNTFQCISPATGERHFWGVMETLALVKAEGQTPVDLLIDRERMHFGSDSLVLVVTPSITDKVIARIVQLYSHGTKGALILTESTGASGPVVGYVFSRRQGLYSIPVYTAVGITSETAAPNGPLSLGALTAA